MKKTNRNLLLTALYLLCLYLACQFVPYSKMTSEVLYQLLIKTSFLCVVLVLCLLETRKNNTTHINKIQPMDYLLLLPFLLPCFSNLIYAIGYQIPKAYNFDVGIFFANIFSNFVAVIIEEMIFRYYLTFFFYSICERKKYRTGLTVFYTSICFSLFHIINFTSGNYLGTLFQIGYTLFLGIILGYFAVKLENIYLPIIGHFSFNFLNMILFDSLYSMTDYTSNYVFSSIAFGAFAIIYFVLFVCLRKRREEDAS